MNPPKVENEKNLEIEAKFHKMKENIPHQHPKSTKKLRIYNKFIQFLIITKERNKDLWLRISMKNCRIF